MDKDEQWHRHFLGLALAHARMSKDPRTKVGAVLVGQDNALLGAGFNGFPRGIADTPERLNDKPLKLRMVVHAEMNAILQCARHGIRTNGATMYVACTAEEAPVYGGPPCTRCTVEAIQAGIRKIVFYPYKKEGTWKEDLLFSMTLLQEAKIQLVEIPVISTNHPFLKQRL